MSDTLTGTGSDTTIPDYPMIRSAACPFAPSADIRQLNADAPVHRVRIWDGSTPWLISGYAELKALNVDPRVSVDDTLPGFPHWNSFMTAFERPRSVFNSDGDLHTHYRRMMTKPFTVKRVAALIPAIERITNEHIDTMLAGRQPADLVTALALPIPSLVISEMLGVPYADHASFQHAAFQAADHHSSPEQRIKSYGGLLEYLKELVERKIDDPSEDLVSELAVRVKDGEIPSTEAAYLAIGLLTAGHETTANMIAVGTVALLQNPEQSAVLRDADDPKLVANAVEELLRYLSVVQNGQRRIAVADIEIAGQFIRAGDGIILDVSPANWDPKVFPDGDRLDLARPAREHVAFGFGPHQCVGQQLARAELQIVYPTILRRIPTLRLAVEPDEIAFKFQELAFGVYTLPVQW
jgi:cytochrome P450